jgi:hypothetical protein
MVDFDRVEPREFWRRAVREAMAESNYDANPLIDALFDAGGIGPVTDDTQTIESHLKRLAEMIRLESNAELLASAAMMLAISTGLSPAEVLQPNKTY